MEKSNYECYNCRNFQRYFVKKKTEFVRTKFGFCCEKQGNVGVHGKCEQFKYKQILYSFDSSVKYKLDELLSQLSVLRMLLEEEEREHEERKKV